MIARARQWLVRIVGALAALSALWFGLQAARHHARRAHRLERAEALGRDKTAATGQAAIEADLAKAELHQANAALARGRAAIQKLKDSDNEALAARVRAYNDGLRKPRFDAPPIGDHLRAYAPSQAADPVELIPIDPPAAAGVCEFDGAPAVCLLPAEFDKLAILVEAARANTEAARHMHGALRATERERDELLAAGQAAEALAELFRALYLGERNAARFHQLLGAGAAGAALLVLTTGTL